MRKHLYLFRFNELDYISKYRFVNSFLVAIYLTLITPIIIKLQGIYFSTQLITVFLILKNLLNKFLEKILKIFDIKKFTITLIALKFIEIIILTVYFYSEEIFVHIYVIFELFLSIFTMAYGISLTDFVIKHKLNDVKVLQIFRSNIWSEGFIIGFIVSLITQSISLKLTILLGILLQLTNIIYMTVNFKKFFSYINERI